MSTSLKSARWLTLIVTLLFVIKTGALIRTFGSDFSVNAVLEQITFDGVQSFLDGGFSTHHFLPLTNFVHETPVQEIRDKRVYTHFLSGDVILSAALLKVIGSGQAGLPVLRIFLALCGLGSIFFFALQAKKSVFHSRFSFGLPLLLAGLFIAPCFYHWNLTFTGISYTNFCVFLLLGLGIKVQSETKASRSMLIGFFVLGFLCIYFYMAMIFVACIVPLLGALLVPTPTQWRRMVGICICVGLGITVGYFLHFWQVAAEVQSWSLAWQDQIGTFINRSGDDSATGPSRLQLIGQYSDHMRGFFRINALHLTFSGLFLAWLLPKHRIQAALSITLATVASYVWILLLKRSSTIHTFIFPQLFLSLYIVWVSLVVRVAGERRTELT